MTLLLNQLLAGPHLTEGSSLAATALGDYAVLVGIDGDSRAALVVPLTRQRSAITSAEWPVPYHTHSARHPYIGMLPSAVAPVASLLHYTPAVDLPRRLLDEGGVAITGWALVGATHAELMDGTLPELGALLDDGQAWREEGRLFLRWEGEVTQVEAGTALPLLSTSPNGAPRAALTSVHRMDVDRRNGSVRALPHQREAHLCFDVRELLRPLAGSVDDDLTGLGERLNALADGLMATKFGAVTEENPLVEMPVADELLFDLRAGGGTSLTEFVPDTGQALTEEVVNPLSSALTSQSAHFLRHRRNFIWPEGRGLKLSFRLSGSGGTPEGRFILRLCRETSNSLYNRPAVLELGWKVTSVWGSYLSTHTGVHSLNLNNPPSEMLLSNEAGRMLPLPKGHLTEVYLFPDRRGLVYVEGVYLAELDIPEFLLTPGAAYTFGASIAGSSANVELVTAEAFTLPAAYQPAERPPYLHQPDFSRTSGLDAGKVSDGSTSAAAFTIAPKGYVEFNLPRDARMSVNAQTIVGQGSRPYLHLDRVAGTAMASVVTGELDGWHDFGQLPSGRYRLSIEPGTYEYAGKTFATNHTAVVREIRLLEAYQVPDNSGPGSKSLVKGDGLLGYFGRVTSADFLSGDALSSMLNVTLGTSSGFTGDWFKFIKDGKVLFVPMTTIRYNVSRQELGNAGLWSGSRSVTIDGLTYRVRLLTGYDKATSEWDTLILKVLRTAEKGTAEWDSLPLSSISSGYGWVTTMQELANGQSVYRPINSTDASTQSTSDVAYKNTNYGWRPVLELVS